MRKENRYNPYYTRNNKYSDMKLRIEENNNEEDDMVYLYWM